MLPMLKADLHLKHVREGHTLYLDKNVMGYLHCTP
jgi:hypothetical protein